METSTAASRTLEPLYTLIPTTTAFPTVTPFVQVEPVKQVLLQYGYFGGSETVNITDAFLGRDVPSLIIYNDGQAIYYRDRMLYTSNLTAADMCALLNKVQISGYFDVPEYTGVPPVSADLVQSTIIQVNGKPARAVFFDRTTQAYLSTAVLETLHTLQAYQAGQPVFYEPQRLLMWIEPLLPADANGKTLVEWPATLPTISQIWSDRSTNRVMVEGKTSVAVLQFFNHRLQTLYVRSQGEVYRVIARPLLPHETSKQISIIPDQAVEFDWPVSCGKPAVYLPSHTPTPLPALPQGTPTATLSAGRASLSGRGRLLFTSDRSGNRQIYMMNSDGTRVERLTNNLYNDLAPAWSPDGQKIAFISNRDGNDEIYIMNADGSNQQRLTHTVDDEGSPNWSPDGKHLVFTRRCNTLENCTSQQDLYIFDIDGKNLYRLTNSLLNEFLPAWSPDGSRVAYVMGDPNGSSIYLINIKGEDRKLFGNQVMNASMPAWSPDGSHIAYVEWDPKTYQSDVYVALADGSQARRLTYEKTSVSQPTWSPDGLFIAFSLRQRDNPGEAIMAVPLDASRGPITLTAGIQNDTQPVWAP
ncbi:MAG: hypothetical protein LWX83_12070 [Anaerolineae bacterium]|nr:hypothetical protein [Anaerolineae bacterium]